jgi:hypothetical protein
MSLIFLNIKMEDDIDGVFEKLRARRGSALCDLSNDNKHDALLLGQSPKHVNAFSDLHGTSR